MIVALGAGRLGNQLFQLSNIESYRKPREWVFSISLGEVNWLRRRDHRFFNTESHLISRIFDVIFRRILLLLVQFRIVSSTTDDGTSRGLLPIRFIYGYFQMEDHISPAYAERIRICLSSSISCDSNSTISRPDYFIHVRRGDYPEEWRLPISYYQNAILRLQESVDLESLNFILLGDDHSQAFKELSYLPNLRSSRCGVHEDLSLMASCRGGIISNSTFAWWGGFLCSGELPILAPLHWLGWADHKWDPPRIETKKFQFVSVM